MFKFAKDWFMCRWTPIDLLTEYYVDDFDNRGTRSKIDQMPPILQLCMYALFLLAWVADIVMHVARFILVTMWLSKKNELIKQIDANKLRIQTRQPASWDY